MGMAPRAKACAIEPIDPLLPTPLNRMASRQPQTISQAIALLQELLPEAALEKIRQHPFDDLIELHFAEGAIIRQQLDLWDPQHFLLRSLGIPHPDDLSLAILEGLWRELQETPKAE